MKYMCYNLLKKPRFRNTTSALTVWFLWIWRHQMDNPGLVEIMPSIDYLCIALFTELLNLASCDIPILITVSTLIESQASADSTFPWSWIMKTHTHTHHRSGVKSQFERKVKPFLYLSWAAATTQWNFITECHTALNHQWSARPYCTYRLEKVIRCKLTVFKKVCDV